MSCSIAIWHSPAQTRQVLLFQGLVNDIWHFKVGQIFNISMLDKCLTFNRSRSFYIKMVTTFLQDKNVATVARLKACTISHTKSPVLFILSVIAARCQRANIPRCQWINRMKATKRWGNSNKQQLVTCMWIQFWSLDAVDICEDMMTWYEGSHLKVTSVFASHVGICELVMTSLFLSNFFVFFLTNGF